jgi:enoyl-CoA hydratase/3-hydroxyacyl-CoA dehydrogenase
MINKIAIIGAGIMGTGIAQKLAMSGFQINIIDINPAALEKSINTISKSLDNAVKKNILESDKKQQVIEKIQLIASIDKLSEDIDLVIEAATEKFNLKAEIFNQLELICSNSTIFATNTSCISINKLAMHIGRRDKLIGMHFFYPAERNKLLEIIPSNYTSTETTNTIMGFSRSIDKIAVVVKDSPGFCVNRFFVPYLNESVKLLEEKLTSIYTINFAAKDAFKAPFGPFDIMNLTGTWLAYSAISELHHSLGGLYTPSNLLKEMAESNTSWDLPEQDKYKDMESAAFDITPDIKNHIYGIVFGICSRMVEEQIATPTDINLAARIGLGWKKGPFELMNELGPSKVYSLVEETVKKRPELIITNTLEETDHWTINATKYSVNNGIAKIKLWRPYSLNALNEQMFLDINENLTQAINDPCVKAICFEGTPGVFSAGADLKFFIYCLEREDIESIMDYTELAHTVLLNISRSPKPVISLIDGLAIGGGLELALHSDYIIATERSSFEFPETSFGLFPGFGGTQTVAPRTGVEMARYLILFGYKISAKEAREYNLIDNIVENAVDLNNFIYKISSEKVLSTDLLINRYKEPVYRTVETLRNVKLLRNIDLIITKKLISRRARIFSDELDTKNIVAVNIANNLINKSLNISLEEGLKLERSYVRELFNRENLLENMLKIINKK